MSSVIISRPQIMSTRTGSGVLTRGVLWEGKRHTKPRCSHFGPHRGYAEKDTIARAPSDGDICITGKKMGGIKRAVSETANGGKDRETAYRGHLLFHLCAATVRLSFEKEGWSWESVRCRSLTLVNDIQRTVRQGCISAIERSRRRVRCRERVWTRGTMFT